MPAAGRSSISAHRRSLMTATAAGAVLCALWFVPSAKATPDAPGAAGARHAATAPSGTAQAADPAPGSGSGAERGGRNSGQGSGQGGVQDSGQDSGQGSGQSATASGTARPGAGPEGLTTPFALSTLVLAGAGGALILRIRSRSAALSSRSAQASSPVAD